MARRSMTRSATTRRMTRDLPEAYDDLVASALGLASKLDDPMTPATAYASLDRSWREAMHAIGARIAEAANEQRAWGSSRPRAV